MTQVVAQSIKKAGTAFGFVFLAGALCTLASGCSKQEHKLVYPVHGQVLLNGKPLADAIVSFHSHGTDVQDVFPTAHTDSEGRFALTSYENGDGAPPGDYSISLVCFRSRPVRNGEGRAENVVPHRYTSPASSGLSATVTPGTNDLQPLKLKNP